MGSGKVRHLQVVELHPSALPHCASLYHIVHHSTNNFASSPTLIDNHVKTGGRYDDDDLAGTLNLQYSRWWSCHDDVDDRVGKKCGGSVGEESSITYREPLFPPTHHPHIIKCKIFLHTVLMEYSIFYYLFSNHSTQCNNIFS